MKKFFRISRLTLLFLSIFFISSCKKDKPTLPILITTDISSITATSCKSGGNISSDGGAKVIARGICWSVSANPTISENKTLDSLGTGEFISSITGLEIGTTYYVRAYATNRIGTAYGNEISFITNSILAIGDRYKGGIVAYIFQPGDPGYTPGEIHGIIAAPSDQSDNAQWGCIGTAITGAAGTAVGTGNQNTIDIMAGCSTSGIAARLCGDLVLGGYSDWYLPSIDELDLLINNRTLIGGFMNAQYWSSTETNGSSEPTKALSQTIISSLVVNTTKGTMLRVRAIRTF